MLTNTIKAIIEAEVEAVQLNEKRLDKITSIKKLIFGHIDLMKKAYVENDVERGKYEEEILYYIIDIL